MCKHKWTIEDDMVGLYLYLYGETLSLSIEQICENLGISKKSMQDKISNYKYIVEGQGLSHFSKQSKAVYGKYTKISSKKFSELVEEIIQ